VISAGISPYTVNGFRGKLPGSSAEYRPVILRADYSWLPGNRPEAGRPDNDYYYPYPY